MGVAWVSILSIVLEFKCCSSATSSCWGISLVWYSAFPSVLRSKKHPFGRDSQPRCQSAGPMWWQQWDMLPNLGTVQTTTGIGRQIDLQRTQTWHLNCWIYLTSSTNLSLRRNAGSRGTGSDWVCGRDLYSWRGEAGEDSSQLQSCGPVEVEDTAITVFPQK